MAIYKTGKVVAAMLQDDTSLLNPFEKALLAFLKRLMSYKKSAVERWLYGQRVTLEMSKRGIDKFLVLGAGVPTSGHVHQLLPEAKVLYVDKDPEVVQLGREIIGDNPKVRYIKGDIIKLRDSVLPEASDFLGPNPKAGIIFIGSSYFIPDDALKEVFSSLYDWCAPGSLLSFSAGIRNPNVPLPPSFKILVFIYALTGNKTYPRTAEQLEALAQPWKVEQTEVIIDYGEHSKLYGYLLSK